MAAPSDLSLWLLTIILLCCCHCHGSAAQPWGGSRRGAAPQGCRFDRLEVLEPLLKVQSEAGSVEYYERYMETNEALRCAGVFPIRVVVDPRGLLLPRYTNVHALAYIVQGSGSVGYTFPGCSEKQEQSHGFKQGDAVAMPAGAQHWLYNDGDVPVIAVYVFDTGNNFNQLERDLRKFLLGGSFSDGQVHYAESIFRGFSVDMLRDTLGVSEDLATKLQSQSDGRGEIVRTQLGLLRPTASMSSFPEEEEEQQEENVSDNESVCAMEVRHSVENADADTYNPHAGRITRLNRKKFPILDLLQMSAVRVDLYQNASLSPFWNFNAHSVIYAIGGRARIQVVSDNGRSVFNGVVRRGQMLIIPQNYAVAQRAQGSKAFRYISFETNPDSVVTYVAGGKSSVFGTMPVGVIGGSFGVSEEEAAELKNSRRHELGVFTPTRGCGDRAEE